MDTWRRIPIAAAIGIVYCGIGVASAQSLRGSAASLERQNLQARQHDFTYLRESAQVRRFVSQGWLVRVDPGATFALKDVSFPFARPEVKLFIERLSRQYRRACGEQLVVTSLTRPQSHQPRNASPDSVHPTGMALDLRRSNRSSCRRWLESTLLQLEERRVLEATRERRPPHYHVAVFPQAYAAYVADRLAQAGERSVSSDFRYEVRRSDTLWEIARRYGVSLTELRHANALRSSVIHPGQVLRVPVAADD